MLSVERARVALRKERRDWMANLKTDYIQGVLFGLTLALEVVNRTYKEQEDEVLSTGHRRKVCRKSIATV